MSINDVFLPMLILTNYDNEYEKLMNKLKSDLRNSKSKMDKNNILNECKKEISHWCFKLMIKCFIIFIGCLVVLLLFHFLLNINRILDFFLILFYISCFALDKYHEKENMVKEIESYASEIIFITADDIYVGK